MLESLEPRRLLSITVANGVLTITGTIDAERLEIRDGRFGSAPDGQLDVILNGVLMASYEPAEINRINIDLGGGADFAELYPVAIPALILGGNGKDQIHAGGAQDTLVGGSGNDFLSPEWSLGENIPGGLLQQVIGGRGSDTIYAVQIGPFDVDPDARFLCTAGAGNDTITCSQSIDTISCGEGDDFVLANPGNDRIDGNAGNDTIVADFGNDKIDGGEGDDFLYGGEGNDTITGGPGRDRIIAHNGNDTIFARDNQRDTLHGDNGTDSATFDDNDRATDLVGEIENVL